MLNRPTLSLIATLALLPAFPGPLEAATPLGTAPPSVLVGDQVLVNGSFQRKCAAVVDSIPTPGLARLKFEHAGCGDSAQVYELKRLQHLSFVAKAHDLSPGDFVTLKGHFGADCSGRVRSLSKTGYVSVDLDALLCADTEALYRSHDLTKISFVAEGGGFSVGQKVSIPGIHEDEECKGDISRITTNGLAQVKFEQLTCAYAGKLYPLATLSLVKAPIKPRRLSGELIYQRVMREIASKKNVSLSNR